MPSVQSGKVLTDCSFSRLLQREPSPSSSSRSFSGTPELDWEKEREAGWRDEVEAYHALVAEGGQPSHPVTLGYDVIDKPEKYEQYKDILWFWHFRGSGYYQEFRYQLIDWRRFRETQEKIRRGYVPRNKFQEYENHVRESQEELGCKWNLRVLADRYQQNRLEDWNEFRAFYYRRLKAIKNQKRIERAEQNLSTYKKKFEDLQSRLTDAVTDPKVIYGRFDEIKASEEEVAEAKSRLESAEKGLRAARRNKSKRKNALMRSAQLELHLAKDNLDQVSESEGMRRLRDGHELHLAKNVMLFSEGELRAAQSEVKRWEIFLKWIDDQYPAIAAECGYAASDLTNVMIQPEMDGSRKRALRPRQHRQKDASSPTPNLSSTVARAERRLERRASHVRRAQIRPSATTTRQPVESIQSSRQNEQLRQGKKNQTDQSPEMEVLHCV